MIASLTLTGAPAGNGTYELDPRGVVTLSGPSGAGKSTVIGALLSLFGVGHLVPGTVVEATSGGKTALSIREGKSATTYSYEGKAGAYKGTAWRDFARWTPPAQEADIVRAIAIPLHWHELARRDLGRPLRDLLMAVLPPVDLRARILDAAKAEGIDAAPYLRGAPDDYAKTIGADATAARAARDTIKGRLDAATERRDKLAAAPVTAPDAAREAALRTIVSGHNAWTKYDADKAAYDAATKAAAEAKAKRDAWDKAFRDLGKRPEVDPSASLVARKAVEEARAEVRRLEREEDEARIRAELEARRATPTPTPTPFTAAPEAAICPTCKRPLRNA